MAYFPLPDMKGNAVLQVVLSAWQPPFPPRHPVGFKECSGGVGRFLRGMHPTPGPAPSTWQLEVAPAQGAVLDQRRFPRPRRRLGLQPHAVHARAVGPQAAPFPRATFYLVIRLGQTPEEEEEFLGRWTERKRWENEARPRLAAAQSAEPVIRETPNAGGGIRAAWAEEEMGADSPWTTPTRSPLRSPAPPAALPSVWPVPGLSCETLNDAPELCRPPPRAAPPPAAQFNKRGSA